MKHLLRISLWTLICFSVATAFAQITTYTIGATTCGVGNTTWIDCQSMPLTLGTTTTTAFIEMDYPGNTAEDFMFGVAGDYAISGVAIVSTTNFCYQYENKPYCQKNLPTEVTAYLTGIYGTPGAGSLDLKIAYVLGHTGRYTIGAITQITGGTVTVN
jgi:hypothetical protein